MAKKSDYQIPFKDGKPVTFTYSYAKDIEWRDNFEWSDFLVYDRMFRGRSAKRLVFDSTKFGRVEMFVADLIEGLQRASGDFVPTEELSFAIDSVFTFRKRGSNFGVCIADG